MSRLFPVLALIACGSNARGPSPECEAYVRCYEATSGSGPTDHAETWGSCWTTTQAASDACTSACNDGLQALDKAYPDAGCLVPEPPPPAAACGWTWAWPPWTCR